MNKKLIFTIGIVIAIIFPLIWVAENYSEKYEREETVSETVEIMRIHYRKDYAGYFYTNSSIKNPYYIAWSITNYESELAQAKFIEEGDMMNWTWELTHWQDLWGYSGMKRKLVAIEWLTMSGK